MFLREQISRTSRMLSRELLYMKFLQGIPVVGAVGGAYDAIYMKQIAVYAKLKYQKRFFDKISEIKREKNMNLSQIHHIAIIVSDYEASKDFYVNKLGFQIVRENYRPERKRLEAGSESKRDHRT